PYFLTRSAICAPTRVSRMATVLSFIDDPGQAIHDCRSGRGTSPCSSDVHRPTDHPPWQFKPVRPREVSPRNPCRLRARNAWRRPKNRTTACLVRAFPHVLLDEREIRIIGEPVHVDVVPAGRALGEGLVSEPVCFVEPVHRAVDVAVTG